MDELYGNESTSSTDDLEVRYEKELSDAERKQKSESSDKDPDRKHFRHFDYGIDTQDNVIIIEGEIQSGMTFDVIAKSRLLTKLNGDVKTFNILLNTPGGDVIETLGLIDFMRSQKKLGIKYNVIVRGAAMSAGALLLACGTGSRMASKHSKIMVHQLSTIVVGKLSDVKSNAKFSEELEDDCNKLMEECTKKDKKYWENISSNDYFISAQQALELGIIDKII
mgnify:CR=1 FL=1|tara:strand:- start:3161 stop:3829 length:669 start_codon:yes stop_codon:yes gene_type:complete